MIKLDTVLILFAIWCLNSKLSATFPVPAISPKVAHQFYDSIRGKTYNKTKVIVSSHNYQQTPSVEDLGNLVARIQATGADIVKIATTAVEITDVARMFQIMVHSQVRHVCLIVEILNKMLIAYTFSLIFYGGLWTLYICVFKILHDHNGKSISRLVRNLISFWLIDS